MLMALVMRAKMPQTVMAMPSTQKEQALMVSKSASVNSPQFIVDIDPLSGRVWLVAFSTILDEWGNLIAHDALVPKVG